MKRRGLIRLIDDCGGPRSGTACTSTAHTSEAKAFGQGRRRGGLDAPRYVQPPFRFEARHFDHSEPVTLSVTALGAATYRPFATRADYNLTTAHSAPFGRTPPHSQPFYVEPFEAVIDEPDGPAHSTTRYEDVEVGGKPGRTPVPARRPVDKPAPADAAAEASGDDFEADLRRMLEEKKRYESTQRKPPAATIEAPPAAPAPPAPVQEGRPKDEHAIFERIAQSMKLANAYDLGSVTLDQRFDAFDREIDAREKRYAHQASRTSPPQHTAEFLEDMDEIGRAGGQPGDGEAGREPEETPQA